MQISIHAPRGGSDPKDDFEDGDYIRFQSTLPVGGATRRELHIGEIAQISIHAPRGGSDFPPMHKRFTCIYFNPRSPWGERRKPLTSPQRKGLFQSTLPVGGATRHRCWCHEHPNISIHAPRGGSDLPGANLSE